MPREKTEETTTAPQDAKRVRSKEPQIEEPRQLRDREVVNALMSCGIYEQVAKEILKNSPSVLTLTTENVETFKIIVREALGVLEKEGVPKPMESIRKETIEKDSSKIEEVKKVKAAICRICRDTAAIHPPYPDAIRRYFRRFQDYKGPLSKDDWLCKNCYGEWYRDNKDKLKEMEQKGEVFEGSEKEDGGEIVEDDEKKEQEGPKKEYYIRTKINLLVNVAKYLAPEASAHRKMLVRYIALNQIQLTQLPVALYLLRKAGSGVIDQEEFEKEVGIGFRFSDLFGFSSWKDKHARKEVLRENEAERKRLKEEKEKRLKEEEEQKRKQEEDSKREEKRQKELQQQREQAEKETLEKMRLDRLKRLKDQRKMEDDEISEQRKKDEATKQKQKDKKATERKKAKTERQAEWKEMEDRIKKQSNEIKQKKEDRIRKREKETAQRVAERKAKLELDKLEEKLNSIKK